MKKYLILGLLFFVSTTVFAKTNDFFNETTNIACVANSGGVTKSHKSEGDFKLERTCVSNEWVDVYTIKGSVVTKKDFYKKFEQYSLKGSTCTAKGTETIKVGSVKFKKVCGTAGKYATYYKNDKKVPYKDFMSLIASEQEKISKTGTTTSKTPGSQKNISEKPAATLQQKSTVAMGEKTDVVWTTTNMKSCEVQILSNKQSVLFSSNKLNGTLTTGPLTSDVSTYLYCIGTNGSTVVRGSTIKVQ